MNIQPVFTRYDINRKIPFDWSSPIVVDHVEDYETRFIEVYIYESIYNKQVDLKGTTIIARIVAALSTEKILLNDNVACTINGSGNIIIPIDGKVIETLASVLLIEIRITQGEQALVLPFPLYVQMRGSILDDAGIAPESRGTIPELLEAAIAALEEAKNYENLENKPQINGHTLSGDKTSDDLGLQKKLTAGQNITLKSDGTISADGGGVTSYNDLTDKPQINGITLSGNKSATDLELREIFFGTSNPPAVSSTKYPLYALWVNLYENTLFVLTATNGSWCNWERFNHRIIQSTEPVQEYSEINVEYQYDNGDLWLQVDSEKIIKISVCMGKHKEFLNSRTWKYFYDWADYSPSATIVSGAVNANGTITFTDSDGNTFTTTGASVIGPQGNPGQDYVLTNQDKSDIADIVLGELPTTEGVLYGN